MSVVVTTKNEEKNIRNCLASIKAQTWPQIEVIVVDNNSSDNTKAIAHEYTDMVFNKGPERSAQRNYGMIEKAKGEYVTYIDADMILSPTLIEACCNYIQSTGAVAMFVSEIVLGKSYLSRVRRFERSFYDGTPIDAARFFRRSIFAQVGGFDESLFAKGSGEDWDIDKMVRRYGSIRLLPRESDSLKHYGWELVDFVERRGVKYSAAYTGIYHNESDILLRSYLRKKIYYSIGFAGYIHKWGKEDKDIQSQFGLKYRFWTVFTENGKWRRLLARPDLALGMYLLRFCVGFVFLSKKVKPANSTSVSL